MFYPLICVLSSHPYFIPQSVSVIGIRVLSQPVLFVSWTYSPGEACTIQIILSFLMQSFQTPIEGSIFKDKTFTRNHRKFVGLTPTATNMENNNYRPEISSINRLNSHKFFNVVDELYTFGSWFCNCQILYQLCVAGGGRMSLLEGSAKEQKNFQWRNEWVKNQWKTCLIIILMSTQTVRLM